MWKAAAGTNVKVNDANNGDADEWETDPDFVNDVSEKEQRWGARTVEGSGHQASMKLDQLREEVCKDDAAAKSAAYAAGPKPSEGYGGKFGVQQDRRDQSALGWEHHETVDKHASQKDYAKGFGGKYGVQEDRVDKSAVGWDHKENLQQHQSQKDYAKGFGGKYGVQSDRVDKSAVGWDHKEDLTKHESQTDYSKGFGGKYGVQQDRVDKSAVGWDHQEQLQKHESQTDYAKGFGGKYGVQGDRVDKSAKGWSEHTKPELHPSQTDHKKGFGGKFGVESDKVDKSAKGWEEKTSTAPHPSQVDHKKGFGGKFGVESDRVDKTAAGYSDGGGQPVGTNYQRTRPEPSSQGAKNLKSRFEDMARSADDEDRRRAEEERQRRLAREEKERSEVTQRAEVSEPSDLYDEAAPVRSSMPQSPAAVPQDEDEDEEFYEDARATRNEPEELYDDTTSPTQHTQQQTYSEEALYEEAGEPVQSPPAGEEYASAGIPPSTGNADGSQSYAIALYDYQAGDDDEISFDPDDVITNLEFIDEGWWRGTCRGVHGLFPANYVEVHED